MGNLNDEDREFLSIPLYFRGGKHGELKVVWNMYDYELEDLYKIIALYRTMMMRKPDGFEDGDGI